ncbi:hypothetical protein HOC13_03530 [Candidatus Woesearchaeota archaeon]|jgi:hypothetical protein|nr:hypothetical protein [Candidatus Woesearchaeota archaeon]
MVEWKETKARLKEHLPLTKQEMSGLVVAILVTGFIFSFRSWGGDSFNLAIGLKNLILIILAAVVVFFAHILPQKWFALTQGYKIEFRTWWLGIAIALVLAFLTKGWLTIIIPGGIWASFMVRQRLGEFRYGFNYGDMGLAALWGILGNLIAAILFRLGNYIFPASVFFEKGLVMCLVFAVCSLIPLPQLDGIYLFYGMKGQYVGVALLVLLVILLLMVFGKIGLIMAIILTIIISLVIYLITSNK